MKNFFQYLVAFLANVYVQWMTVWKEQHTVVSRRFRKRCNARYDGGFTLMGYCNSLW